MLTVLRNRSDKAMKAQDPMRVFEDVTGKALGSIKERRTKMIPVLVALQ